MTMHHQVQWSVGTSFEGNKIFENILLRLSSIEKSVAEQNKNLNSLKDANEETGQSALQSLGPPRVGRKQRKDYGGQGKNLQRQVNIMGQGKNLQRPVTIMEARARICSDRVFLIEAAAGRKDDVYNAIETLFKSSQNTSERLTAMEKTVADIQVLVFSNGSHLTDLDPRSKDGGSNSKYYTRNQEMSDFPRKKKRQVIPPSQIVKHIWNELYESISLPGVRFVGQGTNWLHRYLWVILHLTTFTISFNYIKEAYDTWQNSPVVLSLNNSLTRVADIPFPAVTLCSLPSVRTGYNITQQFGKCFSCADESAKGSCELSGDCNEEDVLALASAVVLCNCRDYLTHGQVKIMDDILQSNLTMIDQFSEEIKKKILPECNSGHFFLGENPEYVYSCESVHTSVMEFIDTPVCITFNSLCPHHLYRDDVVPATLDERFVTCKMTETNHTWTTDNMMTFANKDGTVPLYRDKKIEIMFRKPNNIRLGDCNEGHDANSKIGLHHPGEVPMEENTRFYSFRAQRDINIYISPTLITAHKNLRLYEPSVRGCYFSHERNLTLFKFYTRKNCQMECKVNCSMDVCNCTPNFLPRHNSSMRICHTKKDEYCVRYKLSDVDLSTTGYPACHCDCLPDCMSLSYDFSIDDMEIDPKHKTTNFTSITIKYKDLEFSSKFRYELRNLADFVADSGGFLGVFNGFSFMVVFELFYFLTVRLWSSIKKNWRLAAEEDQTKQNHEKYKNCSDNSTNKFETI